MKDKFIKIHINGINNLDAYFNRTDIKEEQEKFVKNWQPPDYKKDGDNNEN